MYVLEKSFKNPQMNLSIEEVLLEEVGKKRLSGVLRFWESEQFFVVLGHGGSVKLEVDEEYCKKSQIPVFRRISGGGTVLQGPGCLNYSVILPAGQENFSNISNTTCNVMKQTRDAVQSIIDKRCPEFAKEPLEKQQVRIKGVSDLVLGQMKVSGNAQKRTKHAFLFHGTLLYDFELPKIARSLKEPERQPDYREKRTHTDFVRNLPVSASALKTAIAEQWHATTPLQLSPTIVEATRNLADAKYNLDSWNYKFR